LRLPYKRAVAEYLSELEAEDQEETDNRGGYADRITRSQAAEGEIFT
jgi:hypothetical protein